MLKKYNSVPAGYAHIIKECFPFQEVSLWKIPRYYRGCKETAIDSIQKVANLILDPWMMGNPKVINALDYEQDLVTPGHAALHAAGPTEQKRIVDAFVLFNQMLVERSLIDKSFNLPNNFALDKEDRVILMDLGELYSSTPAIQKQINNRAWAAPYVLRPLPEGLRTYFVDAMDAAFLGK